MGDFKGPGQWRRQAVEAREKHLGQEKPAETEKPPPVEEPVEKTEK